MDIGEAFLIMIIVSIPLGYGLNSLIERFSLYFKEHKIEERTLHGRRKTHSFK